MRTTHTSSRLLVASDIHGHGAGLLSLLQIAEYAPQRDRLILLGDYIDADPATWHTLETIKDLVGQGAVALPGNIEMNLAGTSYSSPSRLSDQQRRWVGQLPLYHREDGYLFVHAGLRPGLPIEGQRVSDYTEIRESFWRHKPTCGYTVVFGHTPTFKLGARPGELWLADKRIGIDCGAKHGYRLALVDLHGAVCYSCSTAPDRLYGDVRVQNMPLIQVN